jgi:hypothetical protein
LAAVGPHERRHAHHTTHSAWNNCSRLVAGSARARGSEAAADTKGGLWTLHILRAAPACPVPTRRATASSGGRSRYQHSFTSKHVVFVEWGHYCEWCWTENDSRISGRRLFRDTISWCLPGRAENTTKSFSECVPRFKQSTIRIEG